MDTPDLPVHRDLTRITLTLIGILLLIVGSLWVLLPFLVALLWATTIVVATWPILRAIEARLGGRRGAAVAVMTTALLLVLFVPLALAISTLVEASGRIASLAEALPALRLGAPPAWLAGLPIVGERAAATWAEWAALPHDALVERLSPYLTTAVGWFAAKAGSFGGMIVQFLLTVIIAAILYVNGEGAAASVRRFFRRLSGPRGEAIVDLAGQAVRAVALGVVVTAAVQTVLAGIGLVAVGVPFAGFITAVVLVLCIAQVGPLLGLVPCVIWLYASGSPGRGTALLVVTLVAQTVDNVLRPLLIRRGADISLLVIFPGVIGGLLWLGVIGLFVGPVILAVTVNLLEGWMGAEPGEPVAATGAAAVAPGPGAPAA